ALAGGRTTDDRARLEAVGGAAGAAAGAGLRHVTHARRRATHRGRRLEGVGRTGRAGAGARPRRHGTGTHRGGSAGSADTAQARGVRHWSGARTALAWAEARSETGRVSYTTPSSSPWAWNHDILV